MTTNIFRPSPLDFTKAYETFVHSAVAIFDEEGYAAPQMFVLTMDEQKEGAFAEISAVDPRIVSQLYESEAGKNSMHTMLTRIFAASTAPTLIVTISEAWSTAVNLGEEGRFKKDLATRQEVIVLSVHSLHGTKVGQCPIFSEPTRRCEYRALDIDIDRVEGRMVMAPLEEDGQTKPF
jgi:hypothetical protein